MTTPNLDAQASPSPMSDQDLARGLALLEARAAAAKAWDGDASPSSRTGKAFDHAHDALESWAGANLRALISRLESAETALRPFAEAARAFTFAIGPDGIDDGISVTAYPHGHSLPEAKLSTTNFSAAAAHFKAMP